MCVLTSFGLDVVWQDSGDDDLLIIFCDIILVYVLNMIYIELSGLNPPNSILFEVWVVLLS